MWSNFRLRSMIRAAALSTFCRGWTLWTSRAVKDKACSGSALDSSDERFATLARSLWLSSWQSVVDRRNSANEADSRNYIEQQRRLAYSSLQAYIPQTCGCTLNPSSWETTRTKAIDILVTVRQIYNYVTISKSILLVAYFRKCTLFLFSVIVLIAYRWVHQVEYAASTTWNQQTSSIVLGIQSFTVDDDPFSQADEWTPSSLLFWRQYPTRGLALL